MMNSCAFIVSPNWIHVNKLVPSVVSSNQHGFNGSSVFLSNQRQNYLKSSNVVVSMGLNASNLKKKGKNSKKGGSGSKSNSNNRKERDGNSASYDSNIDTSRKEYIFQMQNVSKTLPNGTKVLNNINLSFFPGAKIGVLGPNGAGKSTLIRIMAGVDKDYDGDALPQRGIRIGYLEQEPELNDGETVIENVEAAVQDIRDQLKLFEELSQKMSDSSLSTEEQQKYVQELGRVQDFIEARDGWELDRLLDRALDALRCPPNEAKVATLSGGERRRVALCKLLLKRPDLLILDEPTNHLDAESVAWLEQFLLTFTGTVVAVTHDRYFLDNAAQWILELDRGEGIPYEGNYSTFLEKKQKRLSQEEKQQSAKQKMIEDELEWVRSNPKGRQTKQKARMTRYSELLEEANKMRSRQISNMKQIMIPSGVRLGDLVIEAENLGKRYGERILFDNVSFDLPKGGIVGVIGANGSGKTTLFRMLTGLESADEGLLKMGETVQIMYVDQNLDTLEDMERSVFHEVTDGNDEIELGGSTINSRAYLSWFNFKGQDQQKRVKDLSGGERNRLALAKVIRKQGNLLLLDEPTNNLDVDTLRNLEEAILKFTGCAVVISHDRWFLDRIATHILAFEGDSNVVWFEGNYQEYEENRKKRLGTTSIDPSRVKFRSIPSL
uniref:Probable ATP-dependent transporter ycf16 n=1 Tax=Timspurckia oligopyrenoides TaxID=708627 RepID=A0A7S1EPY4_9RHOD|mmetsp:Transcript_10994/g.19860  ORF Transcript_10994/g.19860 Transcript_10994/m.19860 type:complete len:665 (+) Transcript_10994:48-2042(+)